MEDLDKKIAAMTKGGKKLAAVRQQLEKLVVPGVSLAEIEQAAQKLIKQSGARIAFNTVPGYDWATCINVNDGVVHGIPHNREIKAGDLVSIDVGLLYDGYYTDTSVTVAAGEVSETLQQFLVVGQQALQLAIAEATAGKRVGHISQAIETCLRQAGYQPVKSLTGHGIGEKLHQKPYVPGFLSGPVQKTPVLKHGDTLAVEVIYAQGNGEIVVEDDQWTISTKDGTISGLFEETVLVTDLGSVILTQID
jgi:methionyl aminopeptidase